MQFNPNNAALPCSGIFGLNSDYSQSNLIILPVPWDATSSGQIGSSKAPKALLNASKQTEMLIPELGNFYEEGIFMMKIDPKLNKLNSEARTFSKKVINKSGILDTEELKEASKFVNQCSVELNDYVYRNTSKIIADNKIAVVIGGEHSVSLGSIKSHAEKYQSMTVLQIDAHHDLREKFETFEYSHASVMFNVINQTNIANLTQIGIRAISPEEHKFAQESDRINIHTMQGIQKFLYCGRNWDEYCDIIINDLTDNIYISLDIDGLEVSFCPNTGTPVPGGINYNEIIYLIRKIIDSGKSIIGFDLVEIATNQFEKSYDINSIIGSNLLYYLCGTSLFSSKRITH